MHGKLDLMGVYAKTGDLYQAIIIAIFETMPAAKAGLVPSRPLPWIAFFATSFDALPWWLVHTPISPWAPRKSLTSR